MITNFLAHTHTAVTKEDVATALKPSGLRITIPAGTLCRKLATKTGTWVAYDMQFLAQQGFPQIREEAEIYGLPVPEDTLTDVKEVTRISLN